MILVIICHVVTQLDRIIWLDLEAIEEIILPCQYIAFICAYCFADI